MVNCPQTSFGNSSRSIGANAGSTGDFTLQPATGSPRRVGSKSRRCPWHVQSLLLPRCWLKRRRSWIVWPSLVWREASVTIMRCCMSRTFAPTAAERDFSCGAAVKGETGRCSIRTLRGLFKLG